MMKDVETIIAEERAKAQARKNEIEQRRDNEKRARAKPSSELKLASGDVMKVQINPRVSVDVTIPHVTTATDFLQFVGHVNDVADMLRKTISKSNEDQTEEDLPEPPEPKIEPVNKTVKIVGNRTGMQWTDAEMDMLKDLWNTQSIKGIAKKMKRTPQAIRAKGRDMGLKRQPASTRASPNAPKGHLPWTDRDVQYVLDNFRQMGAKALAKELGRSELAVEQRFYIERDDQ